VHPSEFSADQRELWHRVESLWRMLGHAEAEIRPALHPRYRGWVIGDDEPHDREAGVRAAATSPPVIELRLDPKRVEVYGATGVAHYTYAATLATPEQQTVTGRWTEVYTREGSVWLLVAVSGGPDRP
jgi:hypothetical protein